MELIKYRVNKFRSVKNTDWIDIDNWACFVGLNESGKTNLLLPLWKFNPADKATEIDLLLDYPRDEYSQLTERDKEESFIEILFKLSDQQLNLFNNYVSEENKKNQTQEVSNEGEDTNESQDQIKNIDIKFTHYLLIKKNWNEIFHIYISDRNDNIITDEIESIVGEEIFKKICYKIPKFIYYTEYGNLDSDLFLPDVISDLEEINELKGKARLKARTLKVLFNFLNLSPEEIHELGKESADSRDNENNEEEKNTDSRNKQDRYALISSAQTGLTKKFKNWWKQGDYNFTFNVDGNYFRIYVNDSIRKENIELEYRSSGLQWFLSFFLVFLVERGDSHKNCVLLLDEPGLSLHPNAQTDLINFFHELSTENQLIYTTHLPFLIDHNNLDKTKVVYYKGDGLTRISSDLNEADSEKKSIQPINAAIGITASQSLLIGCDIVIVEGVSDQFYLNMIKNHLISKTDFKLKNEIAFIPVGGVKGIKPVVSILCGTNNGNLPFVLLDSDDAGEKFAKDLENGLYSGEKRKILKIKNFTHIDGSEIEDIIPVGLLSRHFDRLFRPEYEINYSKEIDVKKPIVDQFITLAEKYNIDLKNTDNWKVEISKKIKTTFNGEVSGKIEKQWEKIFEAFQGDSSSEE